jgi:F-type H+-transporting ATPase subunit b
MKLLTIAVLAAGLTLPAPPLFSQESAAEPSSQPKKEESFAEKHELALKWINFLILAGLLGYFIGKNAGPFFLARSAAIRKDMEESLAQSQEADRKAAEVERRLANLEADIEALRAESKLETKAETERMLRLTAAEVAKIEAHATQEIASAGKAARMELKQYAAELAIKLAEEKVRARMTPAAQDALVQGFVQNLK